MKYQCAHCGLISGRPSMVRKPNGHYCCKNHSECMERESTGWYWYHFALSYGDESTSHAGRAQHQIEIPDESRANRKDPHQHDDV